MSDQNLFSRGYISSGYILNSDGSVNGTLNTLDSSNKTSTIILDKYSSLFNNVWGITSPNTNNQILVMTSDSKYIIRQSYLITLIRAFSQYNSSDLSTNQNLYIALYFILKSKYLL